MSETITKRQATPQERLRNAELMYAILSVGTAVCAAFAEAKKQEIQALRESLGLPTTTKAPACSMPDNTKEALDER